MSPESNSFRFQADTTVVCVCMRVCVWVFVLSVQQRLSDCSLVCAHIHKPTDRLDRYDGHTDKDIRKGEELL